MPYNVNKFLNGGRMSYTSASSVCGGEWKPRAPRDVLPAHPIFQGLPSMGMGERTVGQIGAQEPGSTQANLKLHPLNNKGLHAAVFLRE